MKLDIAVRYGKNKSSQVSAERLVNLYAEQTGGLSPVALHSVPGLPTLCTLPGPIRALKRHAGALYAVAGGNLYAVASSGAYQNIGTVTGVERASTASSGSQLLIVSDTETYVYNGSTVGQITDPDFLPASSVDYLDGYFIFSVKDTGEFIISAISDGTDYDALDFATAESNPDDLVAVFTDHREALLFGGETVEVWTNTGAADFPFERRDGALSEKGCASRDTIARIDNTVFWLDHQGIVRRLADGYAPMRISTHEVEQAIGPYRDQCTAATYTYEGHEFYALTSPVGTFVYDAATQLWHERQSYNMANWRGRITERCYGLDLVGDDDGNIYYQDFDTFTEGGNPLVAMAQFPPIAMEGRRFRVHRFELEMERGTSVLGDPTQVRLDISSDGSTWNSLGYTDLGGSGNTAATQVWRQLGQYERFYPRIIISDPAPRAVYGAYVEIEVDA